MKITTALSFSFVSMLALALPACQEPPADEAEEDIQASGDESQDVGEAEQDGAVGTAEQDGAVGTAEQALTGTCQWVEIDSYTYSDASGNYKWDVTHNWDTGKWYVDEKKIGSTWRKQYVLTPQWMYCPSHVGESESISLKYGTTTMTGYHNCITTELEEAHMPDKQRELHWTSYWNDCI